jgi:hypothetical protein
MIVKIFGLFDIFVALIFFINNSFDKSGWFPNSIVLWAGIYLLVKGLIFALTLDFASILDILCSIIIIISAWIHIPVLLATAVIVLIFQKGFLSMAAD